MKLAICLDVSAKHLILWIATALVWPATAFVGAIAGVVGFIMFIGRASVMRKKLFNVCQIWRKP